MSRRPPRRERAIHDLRDAVDALPGRTRTAMLDGIRANEIIVGAYVDGKGGVCPMLAAHRHGGRTDLLAFARTWDRFTDADGRARRASRRELNVLVAHLEASLLDSEAVELARAIDEHQRLVAGGHARHEASRGAAARACQQGRDQRAASQDGDQRAGWNDRDQPAASRENTPGPGERGALLRAGERDRGAELRDRAGWAWLRPFRRLDDFERALALLEAGSGERDGAAGKCGSDDHEAGLALTSA